MSLVFISYGALRRFNPDRIGRLALFGTVVGGLGAGGMVIIALLANVVS